MINQTEAIEKVVARYGMEALSEGSGELATLRQESRDVFAGDGRALGESAVPSVNHRLQRIIGSTSWEPEKTDGAVTGKRHTEIAAC